MKKGTISRNIGLLMEHFEVKNESQLAKLVGMPQTTINKLITGVSADPRISTLAPLARYFQISLDTLTSENPIFAQPNSAHFNHTLVPMIGYDELSDIYHNISSLNKDNWPQWYPINKENINNKYYAVFLDTNKLSKPFDNYSLLIIENNNSIQNNTYCIVKHTDSNTANVKKVFFDNGTKWLLSLHNEVPACEYKKDDWIIFGTIHASIVDMNDGNYITQGSAQ